MPVIIYKSNDYLNFIIGGLKPSVERIEIFTHDSFFYRCLRALFNGRTQYPKHFFSLYLSNKTIRTLKKVKEPAILLGEFDIRLLHLTANFLRNTNYTFFWSWNDVSKKELEALQNMGYNISLYDYYAATKFNLKYIHQVYRFAPASIIKPEVKTQEYDCYWLGKIKSRLPVVNRLEKFLLSQKLTCRFIYVYERAQQVHATGELSAIIGGKVDKNGKETNIAPSAKAKIALPNMPETKSGNNWITPLDDMIYVQQLSIPGTHDAAAYSTNLFNAGQTQGLDIKKQFDLGIRAYDMRTAFKADGIGSQSGEMWMWHGITECDISLESAMTTLSNALKNNPGEFVILQFRHENELPASYKRTKKWDEIYNVLHKFDSQIVQWRPDLTIHDCRGKFIIITRDDYTNRTKAALTQSYPSGSTFTTTLTNVIGASTSYYVQDYYQYYGDGGTEKIKQILDLYNTKTKLFSNIDSPFFAEKAWALNHTSGYDGISGTTGRYQKNASQVHRPIHNTLTNETDFGPTGIVFMDWVGTREASSYTVYGDLLPQAIIDHNYKYRMLRATAQGTSN